MKPAQKSKSELIEIFCDLFSVTNYDGVSLAMLSEATGLDKGSLYHFFPGGKKEMVAEALVHKVNRLVIEVFEFLAADVSAGQAVSDFLNGLAAFYDNGKSYCLIGVLSSSSVCELIQEQLEKACEAWQATLGFRLDQLAIAKPEQQALALLASVQGALLLERFAGDKAPLLSVLEVYRDSWGIEHKG